MDTDNIICLATAITGMFVPLIIKMKRDAEKPPKYVPPPLNGVPIVSHEPPRDMTPCLALYIMNRGYTPRILDILLTHAAVKDLIRIKDSASRACMMIETLKPSEDFNALPVTERETLFILLGNNFLPGRIFRFIPEELPDIGRTHMFLEERLEKESYLFLHAFNDLPGFKKYLEIGEFTRLPDATPQSAPLLFIPRKNEALEYLPYALVFGLRNKWVNIMGAEAVEARCVPETENSRGGYSISPADLYDYKNKF